MNIPHWPKVPIFKIPRDLNLDRMQELLFRLGDPHKKLPPTIHIAGTNGKGSTLAMLQSILITSGYKVHSYTSPHFINFNERITIANEHISDSYLYDTIERTRLVAEQYNLQPSFFEGTTASALLAFSEQDGDVLLLETGLGGRLDCTNVISNPLATIITSISYDHMEYLGDDLLQIAYEKSGIIKPNIPCIISKQIDPIYKLMIDRCNEISSQSFCYDYDYVIQCIDGENYYRSRKFDIKVPDLGLKGEHQIINCASVIACITLMNKQLKISMSQMKKGLEEVNWPGRIQMVDKEKTESIIGKNFEIYLDGAHNDAGADALANWVSKNCKGKVYMILGMTRNRNVHSFCSYFKGIVDYGYAVNIASEPSNYSPTAIVEQSQNTGVVIETADSLRCALEQIQHNHKVEQKAIIIVTGSLYLISDFYKL